MCHASREICAHRLLILGPRIIPAHTWVAGSQTRAKKLVSEMTTAEKLELFHGSCGGYTGNVCANSRLGIPQFKYNDGPQGFRGAKGESTSWPAALTVAQA